ncbi:YhdH/YhfP family quinone oxidoreductase [Pseudomonas sp. F1_0610]|uniref:YhdH/YhfP family quinone oxidoreductase n=1 Tax=Pseudomonas sp. F1_0610 TaxID=3114284 RepID=UPI0039C49D56
MSNFKAILVKQNNKEYSLDVVERSLNELPEGDVLIRVAYSCLNFKDALSASGNKGVTKQYPHTPGIDAAGVVAHSASNQFKQGDEVIVTGYDLGMNTSGGLAEYIRVPETWVVRRPTALSLRESMLLGTAGLTAALCVNKLEHAGLNPEDGAVLVTGATGGVGSIAVALLAKLGYQVVAATGKAQEYDYLMSLGAAEVISREALLEKQERPMLAPKWAGIIDTVGGDLLFNCVKALKYGASAACCGLTAGVEFNANVFPFILRGVNLLGVDSVELPLEVKQEMWSKLATTWHLNNLEKLSQEINLTDVPEAIEKILKGTHKGRYLVKV